MSASWPVRPFDSRQVIRHVTVIVSVWGPIAAWSV
jgi:hypothetical protein